MTADVDGSQQTVLIIEDMPNVSHLMRAAMQARPVRVEMIRDGKRGLDRAQQVIPALILLDLALPTMHGFDVLRQLRSSAATAHIPVVIVTAQGDSQTALEARRLGANHFVSKPFLLTELRRTVNGLLDRPPHVRDESETRRDMEATGGDDHWSAGALIDGCDSAPQALS